MIFIMLNDEPFWITDKESAALAYKKSVEAGYYVMDVFAHEKDGSNRKILEKERIL